MFKEKVFVVSVALLTVLTAFIFMSKYSFCVFDTQSSMNAYSYLALGDSYSAGQTPYGEASGRSYADIIKEKLASEGRLERYDKKGVSGYKTTDVLVQLPEIKEMIFYADLVTMDIGINDILLLPEVEAYRANPKIGGFGTAQEAATKIMPKIEANIIEIINQIKAANPGKDPMIYVMGYFNAFPNSPEFLPVIQKLNEAIRSAAAATSVHYVDSMPAIDKKLREYLPGDIHPTVEGYGAIAEVFLEQIQKDMMRDPAKKPNDIQGHWAEEYILKYMENGIVRGYEDGSFKPNNPITRAEFITILNNYLNLEETADIRFTDVPENAWYKAEIQKAVKEGFVSGYEDGTFRPEQYVTRQEAAVVIATIMKSSLKIGGNELIRFTDGGEVPFWSVDSLNALVINGIFHGYPDNTIRYKGNLTRAEVLSILEHMEGLNHGAVKSS